jgi:LPXTG-motif cell wall-anchored protein
MLSNLPFTTNDLLVMGGLMVLLLGLSALVFFKRRS